MFDEHLDSFVKINNKRISFVEGNETFFWNGPSNAVWKDWNISYTGRFFLVENKTVPHFSVHANAARRRAWLIILGNDRFPIFIFKYTGETGREALGLLDNFFWRGSTGRVAATFSYSTRQGDVFSDGSVGEKRPFHRSLPLRSPSLGSFKILWLTPWHLGKTYHLLQVLSRMT